MVNKFHKTLHIINVTEPAKINHVKIAGFSSLLCHNLWTIYANKKLYHCCRIEWTFSEIHGNEIPRLELKLIAKI